MFLLPENRIIAYLIHHFLSISDKRHTKTIYLNCLLFLKFLHLKIVEGSSYNFQFRDLSYYHEKAETFKTICSKKRVGFKNCLFIV